jgi:hypothetical protein
MGDRVMQMYAGLNLVYILYSPACLDNPDVIHVMLQSRPRSFALPLSLPRQQQQ